VTALPTVGLTGKIDSFRQFYLKSDITQARIGILLFAIPVTALIFNDYLFAGSSLEFYGLASLRFGLLAIIFFEFFYLRKISDYRYYDKVVSAATFAIIVGGGIINATRPQNFVVQTIITDIAIFMLYLVIPLRLRNQFALASFASIGECVIVFLFLKPTDLPSTFTILLSLVFSNIIAFAISWKIQLNRQQSYQDLVASKQNHAALKEHADKLQNIVLDSERLAIVGATANMVGHDMRSPLMTINCQLYLAKKNLSEIPENETIVKLEKNLELISDEVQYLSDLVSDIQDFSKVLIPKLEDIRIVTFISPLVIKLKIPEQVAVQIIIEPTSLVFATDASFLRRILTNLINNAVQAMPKGGQLTVKAYCDISGSLNVAVEDSGQGIPEEARTKIFAPLFTTKQEGHGFGLASVKRMTEALGGTIVVESQINKGSKFTVKIPSKKVT